MDAYRLELGEALQHGFIQHPVYFSIPVVVLAALWIQRLSLQTRVPGYAAIAMVSALGASWGVLLAASAAASTWICSFTFSAAFW